MSTRPLTTGSGRFAFRTSSRKTRSSSLRVKGGSSAASARTRRSVPVPARPARALERSIHRPQVEQAQNQGLFERPPQPAFGLASRQVDERAREGGAGDALAGGGFVGVETAGAVHDDAADLPAAAPRRRDVDPARSGREQAEQGSSVAVAQHRAGAAGQHRGHVARIRQQPRMPDGVDLRMHRMQSLRGQSVPDCALEWRRRRPADAVRRRRAGAQQAARSLVESAGVARFPSYSDGFRITPPEGDGAGVTRQRAVSRNVATSAGINCSAWPAKDSTRSRSAPATTRRRSSRACSRGGSRRATSTPSRRARRPRTTRSRSRRRTSRARCTWATR